MFVFYTKKKLELFSKLRYSSNEEMVMELSDPPLLQNRNDPKNNSTTFHNR